MNQPSSRHLSHDYEAYKGLSLRELFWIVVITTPSTSLLFIFDWSWYWVSISLWLCGIFSWFYCLHNLMP